MSDQPPRLNPTAYTFVPGQIPNRNQGQRSNAQQQQGAPGAGGSQQYPYNTDQQQGYYPQYGGGYQRPVYGQYGPPQEAYGVPQQNYGGYPQQQQHPRYFPPGQEREQYPSRGDLYNPEYNRSHASAPADRPLIERDEPAPAPAVAPTMRTNIGVESGASTPPKADRLEKTNEGDTAPAARTISLNIGGAPKAAQPLHAPVAGIKPAAASTSNLAPKSQAATSGANTPVTISTPPVSKGKDFNFSADKSKTTTDTVLNDTLAVADEDTLKDLYGDGGDAVDPNAKSHVNIVFVGHVDAGKSTLGGQLLFLTDMVDKRTMEKYEREAKEAGRESWYLSWALDSTTQERAKGKTVEVGRAYFETPTRRYTVLDAPGHKTYVPSMISGAAQADVAILVISARKGEFETGFEKGGQTREHILLVKTAGVSKVIIVINKMDDPTVHWAKERYEEIKDRLTPFIRSAGFNVKADVSWVPISAYTAVNVKDRADKKTVPWIEGPSLIQLLDNTPLIDRKVNGPVMMPISEKYKDLGCMVVGKLESGRIKKGNTLIMMPNKVLVEVAAIYTESEEEIPHAYGGDNVRIRLRGIDDEDVSPGFVLASPARPVHAVRKFEAQLAILDHKNIICAGYSAVMHVHTLAEEVSLSALLHYFDKKTGRKSKKPPQFAKKGQKIIAQIETSAPVCVERFTDFQQLGRFTLRDEGKTVAIGKVTRLLTEDEGAIVEGVSNIALGAQAVTST